MATETLRPNAAGENCEFDGETGAACPNHYQNVDEAGVNDGSTTRNYSDSADDIDLYNIEPTAIDEADTINSVKLYSVCALFDAGKEKGYIGVKTNATEYWGDVITFGASWWEYTRTYTDKPQTSTTWTVAELNALQIGVKVFDSDQGMQVTQTWVVVDYTAVPEEYEVGSEIDTGIAVTATRRVDYVRTALFTR